MSTNLYLDIFQLFENKKAVCKKKKRFLYTIHRIEFNKTMGCPGFEPGTSRME